MSIGIYATHKIKLREIAESELGREKASGMDDEDIGGFIEDRYAIFWGDDEVSEFGHAPCGDVIVLIPSDVYRELFERGDIVFVER